MKLKLPSGTFVEISFADVSETLVGADFYRTRLLLADVKHQLFVNSTSFSSIFLDISKKSLSRLKAISSFVSANAQLPDKIPQLVAPSFSQEVLLKTHSIISLLNEDQFMLMQDECSIAETKVATT